MPTHSKSSRNSHDRRLVNDLNSIITRAPDTQTRLPPAPAKPPVIRQVATASSTIGSGAGGVGRGEVVGDETSDTEREGAVSSPLTELSRTETERTLTSDDGAITITVADATRVDFTDSVGRPIVMILNPPS